jgi:menaquinone-dependent protoporphyrinogen oxidase
MSTVQVVYASRHGATAGIAERIAQVLRTEGIEAVVGDAASQPEPGGVDGFVVGSAVYIGNWLREGIDFLERHTQTLAGRPVWLFSSGPLAHPSGIATAQDALTQALGPEEGPGSGGRRKIAELSAALRPRDHRVFPGAFDPKDPPKSLQERLVRMLPPARRALPAGDFRDWEAIEAWARGIAAEVAAPVAVAVA